MKKVKKDSEHETRLNNIESVYLENKDWSIVLRSNTYLNQAGSKEYLIDYVEELHKTKITSAKQLQELLKVDEDLFDEVEYAFTVSNYKKYLAALKNAIESGNEYKDLLKITPDKFNLPDKWYGCFSSDKDSTILRAIGEQFHLEKLLLSQLPGLRTLAKEIKAPYSILMDAYESINLKIEKFN